MIKSRVEKHGDFSPVPVRVLVFEAGRVKWKAIWKREQENVAIVKSIMQQLSGIGRFTPMVLRLAQSGYQKCKRRAFRLLKRIAIKVANTVFTYRSNRIDVKNIDQIRVLAFLGPYRNLSSFTSAVMALHPEVQVLNHSYNTVITKKTNFITNSSNVVINEFVRRATVISSMRRFELFGEYITGGSILDSHSFLNFPDVIQAYESRFGTELVKRIFQVVVWKESGRLTDYLMRQEDSFRNLLHQQPRIKFVLPIRNPIDCAISNFKLRYHRAESFERRLLYESIPSDSLEGMLEFIVRSHIWCLRFAESYPDRFFVFSQSDIDNELFARLAQFLDIDACETWISDCMKISKFKEGYAHDEKLIASYIGFLDKYDVNSISHHKVLTDWTKVANGAK